MRLVPLLCVAEALACTQLVYDLEVRKVAVDDLQCPKSRIGAEILEHDDPTKCTEAVYVARGCGKEAKYACTPVPFSQQCRLTCALVPDAPDPGPGPGPGKLSPDLVVGGSTEHDHPESCWIDGTGASDESQVDMMLFVVGLNHQMKEETKHLANDAADVRRLADAIKAAWPHPESIVVVSSSFKADCWPTSGACLEAELEARYDGSPFELVEVPNDPEVLKDGTRGVVTGSRWRSLGSSRLVAPSNPGEGIARVTLLDSKTQLKVNVYAVHTADDDLSRKEIEWIASADERMFPKGFMTPIIAGDFNMSEHSAHDAASSFCDHFLWINHDVRCSSVPDLPDDVFRTQNGNVMQALAGRISASEPAYAACEPGRFAPGFEYPCATGYFEPVRISYSVDGSGRLAVRSADRRPAFNEGIVLDNIAHNVLAFGLRLTDRTGALPQECKAPTGSGPGPKTYKCSDRAPKCCAPDPDQANRCQEPCIAANRECR